MTVLGSSELRFPVMAYSKTHKLTDSERKLQMLRTQLYGKEPSHPVEKPIAVNQFSLPSRNTASETAPKYTEVSFLKKDLLKIGILAAIIFTIQATLFIVIRNISI